MRATYFTSLLSILSGVRRFPLPIAASLISTVAVIISIHTSSTSLDEQCARIALTISFGLPLLIGAVYGRELYPRIRWSFYPSAIVVMVGVFLLIPPGMHAGSIWFRFWMLVLMAIAVASLIPSFVRGGSLNWWRVNVGWLNSIVLAAIMTAVVEIGLQLALLSVEKLFGLREHHGQLISHLHGDLVAFAGLLIAPIAAIALFPPAKGDLEADQPAFKVWANLSKWALIPIGFLFMGILGIYAIKILIQWKLPNGMVATPVLSLGAYGTLAMLLILPWRGVHAWARWFSLIYPPAFLLSSILLFISLTVRIREYGFTFDRYSALAAGIWLTISSFCFLIRRKEAPSLVLAFFALAALIAALGPISAATLSLRSQSDRLRHYLEAPNRNDDQIRSIVRMIVQDFGISDLEKVTGVLALDPKLSNWQLTDAVLQKLNVAKTPSSNDSYDIPLENFVPIDGCSGYLPPPQGGWNGSQPCLLGKNKAGEELMIKTNNQDGMKMMLYAGAREIATKCIGDLDFDGARKNKTPLLFPLMGEGRTFQILITHADWRLSKKQRMVFSIHYQIFEMSSVEPKALHAESPH